MSRSKKTEQQFQNALRSHQRGHFAAAMKLYKRVLRREPAHIEAQINLATALKQMGRTQEAIAQMRRTLALNDQLPALWFNLGNALQAEGELAEAQEAYERAIASQPNMYQAHFNLANLRRDVGQNRLAEQHYRKVIALKADMAHAYMNLGNLLRSEGRLKEAITLHRQAIFLAPQDANGYYNLGNALRDDKQVEPAAACYQHALSLNPKHVESLVNLGLAVQSLGQLADAEACWQQALKIQPSHLLAHGHLGALYSKLKQHDKALHHLQEAARLAPDKPLPQLYVADHLIRGGQLSEGLAIAERVIAQHPDCYEAYTSAATAYTLQTRLTESLAMLEKANQLPAEEDTARGNYNFTLLYSDSHSPQAVSQAHWQTGDVIASQVKPYTTWHSPSPQRRPLRIGYLSADLRAHPVGYFMTPILLNHDAQEVAVTSYTLSAASDHVTKRLKQVIPQWHNCQEWSDERLAEQIRADKIDILIDLIGYTASNRARLLAMKPAPMQALYLGYPFTSGLPTIDYLIADGTLIPPEQEKLYREQIIRLPNSFLCFQAQPNTPPVTPPPALKNGFVTFGSYNNLPKVSPTAIKLWASILHDVPNSRLVLKTLSFRDPQTQAHINQQFARAGIPRQRIDLLPPTTPLSAFLAEYARIDIALDPMPYNGGTTTCDALWMGIPVITLTGNTFYSRMSSSILQTIGLSDLITSSQDDYRQRAKELAADIEQLTTLRQTMRQRMIASPLCDAKGFTQHFEGALKEMVHKGSRQSGVKSKDHA